MFQKIIIDISNYIYTDFLLSWITVFYFFAALLVFFSVPFLD